MLVWGYGRIKLKKKVRGGRKGVWKKGKRKEKEKEKWRRKVRDKEKKVVWRSDLEKNVWFVNIRILV